MRSAILYSTIRPHRSTTYVDAAYCHRPSSAVCRSVCHSGEPCKNGWTDRDVVWVLSRMDPRNHVLDGVQIPMGRGNFDGKSMPRHTRLHSAVSCAKTAEPLEMPFGLWTRVGSRTRWASRSPYAKEQFLGERTCPGMPDVTLRWAV